MYWGWPIINRRALLFCNACFSKSSLLNLGFWNKKYSKLKQKATRFQGRFCDVSEKCVQKCRLIGQILDPSNKKSAWISYLNSFLVKLIIKNIHKYFVLAGWIHLRWKLLFVPYTKEEFSACNPSLSYLRGRYYKKNRSVGNQ